MRRAITVILVCFISLGVGPPALAQANTTEVGPLGTPMTPQQIGAQIAEPGLSQAEAEYDARTQGYRPVQSMREDRYGDWIGHSGSRGFIVFPDGKAYPF